MRALLTTLLLASVVLAGCADDKGDGTTETGPTSAQCLEQGLILNTTSGICDEAPFEIRSFEDPNHHCVVTKQDDRVHAPDLVGNPWVLGQSWTYRLAVNDEDLGTTQMIYYDDQDQDGAGVAQHYMVGTPTRDEALRHVIFGDNPMIGRVHRILYSPHESGDHADMFHFPLCEGSTWQTMFYGETFDLEATPATIDTPNGPDDGFLIEGTSQEGGALSLSYSPAVQWFTFIDLTRASGGTVNLDLEATDTGYTGDAFFLRGQKDTVSFLTGEAVAPNLMGGVASETISREDGSDGAYDSIALHVLFGLTGNGAAQLIVTAPDGSTAWEGTYTPEGGSAFTEDLLEVPYQSGDWTVELNGAALDPAEASFFGHVTMVSVYDRSGSV